MAPLFCIAYHNDSDILDTPLQVAGMAELH